jgi:Rad3-related DNA helicases
MRRGGLFPYPEIRPAQLEMISAIKEALSSGKHLVVEGPTGMGKTVAVLCGILESPEAERLRILYCCRTHKQMDRVIEELKNMKVAAPALSLRGRREMCLNRLMRFTSSTSEAAYVCSVLKRRHRCVFFENLKEKDRRSLQLLKEFSNRPVFAEEIISSCKENELCPYEMLESCWRSKNCGGELYLRLDPQIRSSFVGALGQELEDFVLVFDEAHNIPAACLRAGKR